MRRLWKRIWKRGDRVKPSADGKHDSAGEDRARTRERAETASEATVGVASAGMGLGLSALVGPAGPLATPIATLGVKKLARLGLDTLFRDAAREFDQRVLSPRERERVATAYSQALESLNERLHSDDAEKRAVRDDGFFTSTPEPGAPTPAEELLEGVLQKAQHTFETRKAERMGQLWAYIAYSPDISPTHANYLLELAGRLTYRQLVYLGVLDDDDVRAKLPDWSSSRTFTPLEMGLVDALLGLARENLLCRDDHAYIHGFNDINPQRLKTTLNGKLLVEAMGLHMAEQEDLENLNWDFMLLGKFVSGESTRFEAVVPPGSASKTKAVKIDKQVVRVSRPVIRLSEKDLPEESARSGKSRDGRESP